LTRADYSALSGNGLSQVSELRPLTEGLSAFPAHADRPWDAGPYGPVSAREESSVDRACSLQSDADALLRVSGRRIEALGERGRRESLEVDAERMYRDYRRLLFSIAVRKFNVPVSDAETLVQEAWVAFLTQDARIHDPKAWLAATMSNLSRHYWRQRGRIERVEVSIDAAEKVADLSADGMERTLVVRKVLSLLKSRDRDILRLH
jgi:DNA-directed RNA polymerase specialized sigma24 family protein